MSTAALDALAPLRRFVRAMTVLVGTTDDEPRLLAEARTHLAALIADDAGCRTNSRRPDPNVTCSTCSTAIRWSVSRS